jgi:beta-phosphoglucomutase-like phosphatase (HAD superfamily)
MTMAILDIDGTLVDTNYQHSLAWFRAFRRHDIVLPIWRIHCHIGMGAIRWSRRCAARRSRRSAEMTCASKWLTH